MEDFQQTHPPQFSCLQTAGSAGLDEAGPPQLTRDCEMLSKWGTHIWPFIEMRYSIMVDSLFLPPMAKIGPKLPDYSLVPWQIGRQQVIVGPIPSNRSLFCLTTLRASLLQSKLLFSTYLNLTVSDPAGCQAAEMRVDVAAETRMSPCEHI